MTIAKLAADLYDHLEPWKPDRSGVQTQLLIINALEAAVFEERERCYQIALQEANFLREQWEAARTPEDAHAEHGLVAAEVIASLITKSPD